MSCASSSEALIIGEVANASSEQAEGIRQVNQAVAHLDGSTQQNAALSSRLRQLRSGWPNERTCSMTPCGYLRLGIGKAERSRSV
jgi:hypothetical protein